MPTNPLRFTQRLRERSIQEQKPWRRQAIMLEQVMADFLDEHKDLDEMFEAADYEPSPIISEGKPTRSVPTLSQLVMMDHYIFSAVFFRDIEYPGVIRFVYESLNNRLEIEDAKESGICLEDYDACHKLLEEYRGLRAEFPG
ncbi:hypothetical protein GOV11_00100 [Candidatus Woesearchaeota archaeon]|nr:hypothetical protein [Candidatus Woesearchaeota archaeon]